MSDTVSGEGRDLSQTARESVQNSVGALATRVAGTRTARVGDILLRLSGQGGGTYRLAYGPNREVQVAETADVGARPLIEVIGDAQTVQAVIDGRVDARTQFLAGGIRVRGDLQYLSNLALELGLLRDPL